MSIPKKKKKKIIRVLLFLKHKFQITVLTSFSSILALPRFSALYPWIFLHWKVNWECTLSEWYLNFKKEDKNFHSKDKSVLSERYLKFKKEDTNFRSKDKRLPPEKKACFLLLFGHDAHVRLLPAMPASLFWNAQDFQQGSMILK